MDTETKFEACYCLFVNKLICVDFWTSVGEIGWYFTSCLVRETFYFAALINSFNHIMNVLHIS